MPTKHLVRCYGCGYEFNLTVRAQNTFCPKCRIKLDLIDYTIDSEWGDALRTAGCIRITPTGVVKSGELLASDVVLEGRIEGGRVEAVHRLELRAGAVFQEKDILAQDLLVASGVSVEFQRDFRCRDLDIRGAVSGSIRAAGRVTIHAAGLMKGRLQARQLVVEEGGGLVGDFAVRAEESA